MSIETRNLSVYQLETLMEALTQFTDNLRDTLDSHEPTDDEKWFADTVERKRVADDMLETVEAAHHGRLMGVED